MRGALKFLVAGMALAVIAALGAIFYSLFEGAEQTDKPASGQPQTGQQHVNARQDSPADPASAHCPVREPSGGYVDGKYTYRLSREVFPPSPSLQKEIDDRYGNHVELADWTDLKAMLVSKDDIRKFIQDTDIQLQSKNYDCDNILVSRSGSETVKGLHYHLARHDGKVPTDWSVLDSIGSNDIDLGRWNHSGQALLRLPHGQ